MKLPYDDCVHWDDERLISVYERLSRDLRLQHRKDLQHIARMMQVEIEMRARGIDPAPIAAEVEKERGE